MDNISSNFTIHSEICFEKRVSEITPNEERLQEIVENLNAKVASIPYRKPI